MDNKKIGQFISELRKEQKLNQKELAQKLNITDKAVSKWETGRGIPDVSLLQPISEIFGVSIAEILNGERTVKQETNVVQDKKIIRKLKFKKYIRFTAEGIITALLFYVIYLYIETFKGYGNVLDLCLHRDEIRFISICTIAFALITAIWILVVLFSAAFKRKASVLKTIIICSALFFVASTSVCIAISEDNRYLELYDFPIDTINYIHYDSFFDDDFDTQIRIEDTNDKITEHYTCMFDGKHDNENGTINYVYTTCVKAKEFNIADALYKESRKIYSDADLTDLGDDILSKMHAAKGYYITGLSNKNDLQIVIIKNNTYFNILLSKASINDETLINLIKEL